MTPDLTTSYLGLTLRSPIVASASPLTGHVHALRRLDAAGVGAVVLPSLFEEQIAHDALAVEEVLRQGSDSFGEVLTYFPLLDDYNTGPDLYLTLIDKAKAAVSVPVIASLNGFSRGGWIRYAALMEQAGADALELNVYYVASDPAVTSGQVEAQYVEVVAAVRDTISIPLAVKVAPFFTSMAQMAQALVAAGADGLVLFNRFYQPDVDLHLREVRPRLVLSTSDELRLPLRWIAILRGRVEASLAASTGVHTAEDVAKVLVAGADVAMMTSALLRNGPEHVAVVERALADWMVAYGYESVTQLRGSMSQEAVTDPAAYERASYMKTIVGYAARYH